MSNITYHRECSNDDGVRIPSSILSDEIKDKYVEHNPEQFTMPTFVTIDSNGYYIFIGVGNDRIDISRD